MWGNILWCQVSGARWWMVRGNILRCHVSGARWRVVWGNILRCHVDHRLRPRVPRREVCRVMRGCCSELMMLLRVRCS